MRSSVLSAVALCLLTSSASVAQIGPCIGVGPNPLFQVTQAADVTLYFEHFKPMTGGTPSVVINGNHITITQFVPVVPPPVAVCNIQTVSLGALPHSTYDVTWNYQGVVSGEIFQSFAFSFAVPATDVPALDRRLLLVLLAVMAASGAAVLRR